VTKAPFKSNVRSNERSLCDSNSATKKKKKVKQIMLVIKVEWMRGEDHLKDLFKNTLKIHHSHLVPMKVCDTDIPYYTVF
jgi:hypothetical protein